MDLTQRFDVLVIGGGNALCAAISARLEGASSSFWNWRKLPRRQSRHTRNMLRPRYSDRHADRPLSGGRVVRRSAPVTEGETDEELLGMTMSRWIC